MPRGGRRPGAGAPRGNVNAVKHGLHSQQFKGLVQQLAAMPEFRVFLARFARLHAQRRAALKEQAAVTVAVAAWLRFMTGQQPTLAPPGQPIPKLTKAAVRMLAERLAGESIRRGLVRHTHQPSWEDTET